MAIIVESIIAAGKNNLLLNFKQKNPFKSMKMLIIAFSL